MDFTTHTTALMSAVRLPDAEGAAAPDMIHLLPAGTDGLIQTDDRRGPYKYGNAAEIIAASFAHHDRLPIDENHSIDHAAPKGKPAPARGWITGMQERADGIWGKVEWTAQGAELVTSRAYRDISPVILHDSTKQIRAIPRASLVNEPNLRGLTSLHQKENDMDLRGQLIEMLGLGADASDADIMKGIKGSKGGDDKTPALQSAMGQIGTALGLADDAAPDAIVTAVQAAQKAAEPDVTKDGLITELQASVTKLSATVTELQSGITTEASEAFYERALQAKRAGVGPASKEHWVTLHQKDPTQAEALVAAMPQLDQAGTSVLPPEAKDGVIALNASQKSTAAQLGMSEEDYAGQLKKIGD